MAIKDKKDWAKLLFVRENLTQKEISKKVGVTEKTMSSWVNKESWDKLRKSLIVTKEEQLRRFYDQMDELNRNILTREEGKRYSNSKEADTLNKLATAVKKLEMEASIADTIEVSKRFLNWLRQVDFEKAKEVSTLLDAFVKEKLR